MLHQVLHRVFGRSVRSHRPGGLTSRSKHRRGRRTTFEALEPRNLLSITVNTLVDEDDGIHVGGVSLREAVAAAGPYETILFDEGLAGGVIRLEHGQMRIRNDVQIIGLGADRLTIDAQHNSRIFYIPRYRSVALHELALTGGNVTGNSSGGAIYSLGNVVLDSVVITNSFASVYGGAIHSHVGSLHIIDSTIADNWATYAGAISVRNNVVDTFVMERSAIINNKTDSAGALRLSGWNREGSATIINSTLSGNMTLGPGGAIQLTPTSPPLTIINSTITDNHANLDGKLSVAVYGGGGIRTSGGKVTLHNTILAGNTAGHVLSSDIAGGLYGASFNSLIGIYPYSELQNGENGNQIGKANAPLDPMLAPLGDYGGPTLTHEPLPGSPVVDAARNDLAVGLNGEPLIRDGRGYARRFDDPNTENADGRNTIVDIGAVEWRPRIVSVWQDFIAPAHAGGVIEPLPTVDDRAIDEALAALGVAQFLRMPSNGSL